MIWDADDAEVLFYRLTADRLRCFLSCRFPPSLRATAGQVVFESP
jgi:hypothetical protein